MLREWLAGKQVLARPRQLRAGRRRRSGRRRPAPRRAGPVGRWSRRAPRSGSRASRSTPSRACRPRRTSSQLTSARDREPAGGGADDRRRAALGLRVGAAVHRPRHGGAAGLPGDQRERARRSRRSRPGCTGCPWPSSWRPRGSSCSRPEALRDAARGPARRCCRPARATCRSASRRCAARSPGATTCSTRATDGCSTGCPRSRAASTSPPPRPSAARPCELGMEVVDGLVALADQSLIRSVDTGGDPRFQMLETIREYAAEKLAERGEADAVAGAARRLVPRAGAATSRRSCPVPISACPSTSWSASTTTSGRCWTARRPRGDGADGDRPRLRRVAVLAEARPPVRGPAPARRDGGRAMVAGGPRPPRAPPRGPRRRVLVAGRHPARCSVAYAGGRRDLARPRRQARARERALQLLVRRSPCPSTPEAEVATVDPDGKGARGAARRRCALYEELGDVRGEANVRWGIGQHAVLQRHRGTRASQQFRAALEGFRAGGRPHDGGVVAAHGRRRRCSRQERADESRGPPAPGAAALLRRGRRGGDHDGHRRPVIAGAGRRRARARRAAVGRRADAHGRDRR